MTVDYREVTVRSQNLIEIHWDLLSQVVDIPTKHIKVQRVTIALLFT